MNMKFEFATASRIIFGPGTLREAGPLAKGFGGRALVVTGRNTRRAQPLLDLLREHGVGTELFSVAGEPELETVERGTAMAKQSGCGLVIGFGGGGAIDSG